MAVVPVWHRWIIWLIFQTICLLWPRRLHCWNDFGQQSLDLRSWPSRVVSYVYGELFCLPNQSIKLHKLHHPAYAWVSALACWQVWSESGYHVYWRSSQAFQMFPATQGTTVLLHFSVCSGSFQRFWQRRHCFLWVQCYHSHLVGEILLRVFHLVLSVTDQRSWDTG